MDNNETTNGGEHQDRRYFPSPLRMTPLEIEEEIGSLVDETGGDFSSVVSKLTLRKKKKPQGSQTSIFSTAGVRHLLRTKTAFAVRNAIVLALLGWLVLLFVDRMSATVGTLEHDMEEDPRGVHQSSFGGKQNTGQPTGAKARKKHEDDDTTEDANSSFLLPFSNVGQEVPSMSMANVLNEQGHYWHDPYQSPFASHLYDLNDTVLDKAQYDFDEKMNAVKEGWGAWDLIDPYYEQQGSVRPKLDARQFQDGDVPLGSFPPDSWQTDEEYVSKFLEQARHLIDRVKTGIFAEYGFEPESSKLTKEKRRERDEVFRVILDNFQVNEERQAVDMETREPFKGIAYLNRNAWNGLVRKLLHGIVTNGDFYVVLAGDGTAAGHGNNFIQSSVISFHYLMEPVLNILGMRLISRNMAMQDASTTFSSMGGADIYGEADILWYSSETAESEGQLDLLHRQAIMSGARVPLLLTPYPGNVVSDSKGTAWTGSLQPGHDMCDAAQDEGQSTPACQFVTCKGGNTKSTLCPAHAYDSVCWINRKDGVVPVIPQDTVIKPTTGYPGYRAHQLEGRKLSLLILHALEAAFDVWENGIEVDGFPLKEDYWHVGDVYENIRESVRTNVGDDGNKRTACESLFPSFPMVCHLAMHAYTDWTPRVTPLRVGLRAILHPDMNVSSIYPYAAEVYEGIDLLPHQWAIPLDQIDVHAIAIVTAAPPPDGAYDDYSYDDDGIDWAYTDDYTEDDDNDDDDTSDDIDGSNWRRMSRAIVHGSLFSWTSTEKPAIETPHRRLAATSSSDIPAGKGWSVYKHVTGFCDGSSQSTCNRASDSRCLMAGHNDHQSGLLGDGLSGWLKLSIPGIKEGIILARIDLAVGPRINKRTEGWTTVDQGRVPGGSDNGTDDDGRELGTGDLVMLDLAVNGKTTTLSRSEFREKSTEIVDGVMVYPLLLDEAMAEEEREESDVGKTIEVAIRVRSTSGRDATIVLSHIYYA